MHDPYQYLLQVECLKYRRKSRVYLFFPLGGTFSALWARMQPETVYAQKTVTIKTTNLLCLHSTELRPVCWLSIPDLFFCWCYAEKHLNISIWSLRLNSTRTKTEVYFDADLITESRRQLVSKSSYGIRDGTAVSFMRIDCSRKPSTAEELLIPLLLCHSVSLLVLSFPATRLWGSPVSCRGS